MIMQKEIHLYTLGIKQKWEFLIEICKNSFPLYYKLNLEYNMYRYMIITIILVSKHFVYISLRKLVPLIFDIKRNSRGYMLKGRKIKIFVDCTYDQ